MLELPSLRRETRYGMPAADQIMFNRYFVIGYSYYFRQAKWALEIVSRTKEGEGNVERLDNFRPDYRIPEIFRAELKDFERSGFDRGHLVASANQRLTRIQNSETFLLSNMSPQAPNLNRKTWRELEKAVRTLDAKDHILETYVISGPIFDFDKPVQTIGKDDNVGVTLPIPHYYFKSVLAEDVRGNLRMWSFVLPNENSDKELEDFQISTSKVEVYAGLLLWERLTGTEIREEKDSVREMWER